MTGREQARLRIQDELDSTKTAAERNRLGQFSTPPALAAEIVRYTVAMASPLGADAKILEPSCGTGAFLTALCECPATASLPKVGVELAVDFSEAAKDLWKDDACIVNADFLDWAGRADDMFDLLVANPPYVRHHHLTAGQKARYGDFASKVCGRRVSGLSGLYVYFMLAATARLKPGAVASWLVPAEFMSVNYGSAIRDWLAGDVTLERIHAFRADDLQFDDALVTSCVVTCRNAPPARDHQVAFTFGASFADPDETYNVQVSELRRSTKWLQRFAQAPVEPRTGTALGRCFSIRRGIATGGNSFFIRRRELFHSLGISDEFLRPILPSPRHTPVEEILSDADGWPANVEKLALLDCTGWSLEDLPHPVREYLRSASPSVLESYLARGRKPWYAQERREAAPIVCTYMGRRKTADGSAFRFIRNRSRAIVTNSYLMLFPKPSAYLASEEDWLDDAWMRLSRVAASAMCAQGREYGGGLHKIEPKELAKVAIPDLEPMAEPMLFY
ncbi:MAG: Eco57I restriction-modification methylase domain-containing protein [Acidobacteriota bacterium]|jgi:hypothetical protein|nr:Eco57I restriction-modification methylase domain-containing protein [Acidobacteriota bacterium]